MPGIWFSFRLDARRRINNKINDGRRPPSFIALRTTGGPLRIGYGSRRLLRFSPLLTRTISLRSVVDTRRCIYSVRHASSRDIGQRNGFFTQSVVSLLTARRALVPFGANNIETPGKYQIRKQTETRAPRRSLTKKKKTNFHHIATDEQ